MSKQKLANILSAVFGICMMAAAFGSVTSAPASVQRLWIGLTGFVWFITGYIRGYGE